jgi:hypothetical protein
MKKITLTLGLVASILTGAFAQNKTENTNYEKRKLKFEEANFVASYYVQDGNNSAVTGGIGTEALTDYAASFDLKLSKYDKKGRQHSFNADFNIDYYTSASSDNIDPLSISGASREDLHIYPSLSWNVKNDVLKTTQGLSLSYSTEWDYESRGISFNYSHSLDNDNREVSIKGGAFFDTWEVILPSELRTGGGGRGRGVFKNRNSYNLSLGVSQVISQRLQAMLVVEPAYQHGLLSTPYHRTYFTNGTHTVERLPGNRIKLPVALRLSYFAGDKTIFRSFYRYYMDDWGMKAHTVNLEATYKFTPFMSISPYYRVSRQSAVSYFQAYKQHSPTAAYYTSDYDLSGFTSNFVGAGFRMAPPNGLLGMRYLNSLELRYGYYARLRNTDFSTNLISHIVTMAIKIK